MSSLSSSRSLLLRLENPSAPSQTCATSSQSHCLQLLCFPNILNSQTSNIKSCYYAKNVFLTSGDMNKMQLQRRNFSLLHPTQDHNKRKGWGMIALSLFFVFQSMESLLKSSTQITNRSNSPLKDTYVTLTNMNQSHIEIAKGTAEIRVFRFLY